MRRWTRRRIILVTVTLLVAATAAAIIVAQAGRSKPAPDVTWLHDYALLMSTKAMSEPHPDMQYVLTTAGTAQAALGRVAHTGLAPTAGLYLAILHGHFTYTKYHGLAESTPPKGTTLVLYVDAATHAHLGLFLTSGNIDTKGLGHLSRL